MTLDVFLWQLNRPWYLRLQHQEGSCYFQLQRQESPHQERNQMQGKIKVDSKTEMSMVVFLLSQDLLNENVFLSRMMNWLTCTHWSWIRIRLTRWRLTMRRWSPDLWRRIGTSCPPKRSRTPTPRNLRTGTTAPRSTTRPTPNLRWDLCLMISVDAWVPRSAFKTNCFQCSQDWDKLENIPDPDAKKPEDWDEDMDGEWEPAMIPNPEYKVKMSTLADVFMLQSCADCWYFYISA